jgi:hypothetical protein
VRNNSNQEALQHRMKPPKQGGCRVDMAAVDLGQAFRSDRSVRRTRDTMATGVCGVADAVRQGTELLPRKPSAAWFS